MLVRDTMNQEGPAGAPMTARLSPFAAADWMVLGFCVILLGMLISVRPLAQDDDWYHLAVMRAFSERGFTTHAWWQYQPPGRPHLYPPLLHLAGAALIRFSPLSLRDINNLYKMLTYPTAILLMWWGVRLLHGRKVAFWFCVLMASEVTYFYPGSVMILPASWVLFFMPILLWLLCRGKWLAASLLFTAGLYTHNGIPLVILIMMLLMAWRMPEIRSVIWKVMACSLLLYMPWLVHLAGNLHAMHAAHTPLGVQIPILIWLLGLPGWWRYRNSPQEPGGVWECYAMALLVFLPRYGHRFWPYVCVPLAVYGAMTLAHATGWTAKACRCLAVLCLVAGSVYLQDRGCIQVQYLHAEPGMTFMQSPFGLLLRHFGEGEDPFEDDAMSTWVKQNTDGGDIIVVKSRYRADRIFALTGRRTTNGGWPEVETWRMHKEIEAYIHSGRGRTPEIH